jgi:hypothetical protein
MTALTQEIEMIIKTVTISFSATIPTQPFANVVIHESWTADVEAGETAESVTAEIYRRIHESVIEAVKPIVTNKVKGMEAALSQLPKDTQAKVMAEFGPAVWLRANMPEVFAGAKEAMGKDG